MPYVGQTVHSRQQPRNRKDSVCDPLTSVPLTPTHVGPNMQQKAARWSAVVQLATLKYLRHAALASQAALLIFARLYCQGGDSLTRAGTNDCIAVHALWCSAALLRTVERFLF